MKKVTVWLICVFGMAVLVGCGAKDKPADTVVVTPPVEEVVELVQDDVEVVNDIEVPEKDFSEYQLNVNIVSTDADGNEYGVETMMYKKGDKSLYVIENMTGPQELPFTPNQNLLVGNDLYSNIEINGEDMWFKAENIEDQGSAMFDLATMQEQLLQSDQVTQQKDEEIEGTPMTCYYMDQTEGKVCLVDGVFAYGEDADPVSGMRSVIKVSNYTETVEDSVFVVPSDDEVKDMSEFMQLMMEQLQAEGTDAAIVPEEALVEGDTVEDLLE